MENILGTNLDRIVILAYFAVVMGFGAYFGKYSKTTSDYFFGGRRFAWWLITYQLWPLVLVRIVLLNIQLKHISMAFRQQ